MFNKTVKSARYPGVVQPIDQDIKVTNISFNNDQMVVDYNIMIPGAANIKLRSGTTSVPCPPALRNALLATFEQMIQPMLDRMNAEYDQQVADLNKIKVEAEAQVK